VVLLLADEVDRLTAVVDRRIRQTLVEALT
jgi:hypothetical protein